MPLSEQSRNSPVDRADDSRIGDRHPRREMRDVIAVGSAEDGPDVLRHRTFDVVLTDETCLACQPCGAQVAALSSGERTT
jgi:hypothetical protein